MTAKRAGEAGVAESLSADAGELGGFAWSSRATAAFMVCRRSAPDLETRQSRGSGLIGVEPVKEVLFCKLVRK